jgi:hypothetical protein
MTASPDHARFAEWDAAYVLGALSAGDRRDFEAHLEECDLCRRAVAELGPTVGLLSRVPRERATEVLAADQPEDAVVSPGPHPREAILSRMPRARRTRSTWWIGAAAAAALVIAAVAVPVTIATVAPRGSVHTLADLADVPLQASVRLTDAAWGTRIDLVCRYTGEVLDAPDGGWPYALAVVDGDGATTTLSTWRATPGSTTQLSAGTDLSVGDIGAVEIRTVDGTDVLMRYDAE